ncbi:hypothetical protein Acsp01_91290 [Actinoplanes sp. NBRC 101535]|nr:hypothetical protein Acsp01_91290 [Actinoplanes sp. NBRC 101535]
MASSLITALTVTAPHAATTSTAVTEGNCGVLLDALAKIPDPRDRRGIRVQRVKDRERNSPGRKPRTRLRGSGREKRASIGFINSSNSSDHR